MHVAAAQHILECQRRVEAGEYEGTWTQFCQEHFTSLKERRIRELLSIARSDDPKKALEKYRASTVKAASHDAGSTPPARDKTPLETIDEALGVSHVVDPRQPRPAPEPEPEPEPEPSRSRT